MMMPCAAPNHGLMLPGRVEAAFRALSMIQNEKYGGGCGFPGDSPKEKPELTPQQISLEKACMKCIAEYVNGEFLPDGGGRTWEGRRDDDEPGKLILA